MRKVLASLAFVLSVALLTTGAFAQVVEEPPVGPDPGQYVSEEDHTQGRFIQAKYPVHTGPEDPGENPFVITEPLSLENRVPAYQQSLAASRGAVTSGSIRTPSEAMVTGPGAILLGPRGSASVRGSREEVSRGLRKVIRQLG